MKYKYRYLFILSVLFMLFSCKHSGKVQATYDIVPKPQEIVTKGESGFVLNSSTQIVYPAGDSKVKQIADLLSSYIFESTNLKIESTDQHKTTNVILLTTNNNEIDNSEGYTLTVNKDAITIDGVSDSGVFYGIQTLRKALPVGNSNSIDLPEVVINDYPQFGYRGMHLDVARHTYTLDSIKIFIDMLAMHNINRLHWHLTDDQGWRLEIKKYPELAKVGSQREQTVIGKNTGTYDAKPYGGFFTQEEVKEIINYAQDRYITVIPEIDLPGHMLAALTTYPNLGCTGGPYKTAQSWGVFDDVLCAGNEDIYPFLENIFEEVIDLFPSEYIHIGGDECPKSRWEKCPKCQAKIKQLGLKADANHTAEQKLQSYVIQRIEKFINSKGRKVIGWDEILEGGIAPNATIMSWRGVEGGIIAAKQGHDAIMTPTSYMYFDYYQSENLEKEYFGIGSYVSLEKVYSYQPITEELTKEQQKHIIGVQANLWSEYIHSFKQAQYMVLPRMAALCEVQWSNPASKDYNDFVLRLMKLTKLYDKYSYNYAKYIFDVQSKYTPDFIQKKGILTLSTFDNSPIYYTLDGTTPTNNSSLYTAPLDVTETTTVKAVAIRNNGYENSQIMKREFDINKATFKPITLLSTSWKNHAYNGEQVLVDGEQGAEVFSNGSWIGYNSDVSILIDLEETSEISSAKFNTFIDAASWIFNCEQLSIETSVDNKVFVPVFSERYDVIKEGTPVGAISVEAQFAPKQARYIKIEAKRLKEQPNWGAGPKKSGLLFIDEIQIK